MSTTAKIGFSLLWRVLSSVVFLCLVSAVCLAATDIDIQSHYLEYDEAAHYMVATGSVTITWKNKVLKADQVKIWVENKFLLAENNVTFLEGKNVMFADRLAYDYQADSAVITHASGYVPPQYFQAQRIVRVSSGVYETGDMEATTCDHIPPHYVIRARHAKIILGKRIIMYSPIFYLRTIPILYLPIFSAPLGSHHSNFEIMPGYESAQGLTLKSVYGYPFNNSMYGKLYLDDLGKQGWGEGGELTYSSTTLKGSFYAYHNNDDLTGHDILTLRSQYWQKLSPLWTGQMQMDYISDSSINDSQYLEDKRVDDIIHSFGSLTRQNKTSSLRLYAEEYQTYNSTQGIYVPNSITSPAITYTLFPQKWNMPFYTSFTGTVQDQYTQATGQYELSGNTDLNITREIRLTRTLTYKPQMGIQESWVNQSTSTTAGALITSYYTNNNLRIRPFNWMDWDLSHAWTWQTDPNSLALNPNGETTNSLGYENIMTFGKLRIKETINYNLHLYRTEDVTDWRIPFSPLVNELYWSPKPTVSMFCHEENAVYPYQLNSVSMDDRFGKQDVRYFNFGVFYTSTLPNEMDYTTGFGFWPSKKWKIDYALHWTSVNDFQTLIANDHEIRLYRDLHCWEFRLTYRHRPDGTVDINFNIGLKSSAQNNQRYPDREAKEFYYWR
ncbi:MAG: hypothetical protein ABSH12_07705 [Endomicrobiales bacterium]